jgi:hypothetical protein
VASKENTGSARAAPEKTMIKASIAPKYRAKGAVNGAVWISFTPSSYVSRHNEMPDHIAASLAGKQPARRRVAQHRLQCTRQKMSTDVHRS